MLQRGQGPQRCSLVAPPWVPKALVIGCVGVAFLLAEALPHAAAERKKRQAVAGGFNIS